MQTTSMKQYGLEHITVKWDWDKQPIILNRGREVVPTTGTGGYQVLCYGYEGKGMTLYVHRLVCTAAYGRSKDKPIVNHKDFNTANNCADNLEWVTQEYSIRYKRRSLELHKIMKSKEFIQDWFSPMPMPVLCAKYDISTTSARNIGIPMYGTRERYETGVQSKTWYVLTQPDVGVDWMRGLSTRQLAMKYALTTPALESFCEMYWGPRTMRYNQPWDTDLTLEDFAI